MASQITKLLFSAALLMAAGCYYTSPRHLTVRGQVIDDTTSQPIDEAIVVAVWTGHRSGFMTGSWACYHFETTRTVVDGSFEIKTTVPPSGMDEPPDAYPSTVVYKPGYQSSLKRAQKWATSLSAYTERLPLNRTKPIRYLVPTDLDTADRIRYLNFIADAATCEQYPDSNLRPLLSALTEEADAIAKTGYEKYLTRRLKHGLELASGNKNPPYPPAPQRDFPSVVEATKGAGDASRLWQALHAPLADPNERDDDDTTALMIAARFRKADLVRILLDAGADPNKIETKEGNTALIHAVFGAAGAFVRKNESEYSRSLTIIQLLLNSPIICPDIRNVHGISALDYARGGNPSLPVPEVAALIEQRRQQRSCAP